MTMTTADLLQGNLDNLADNLTTIWAAIDRGAWSCEICLDPETEHDDDTDHDYRPTEDELTYDDPTDALHALPLEIVWESGEPFAVVFATGGPHIELTGGGRSGDYALTGHWAGTTTTLHGPEIDRCGDYFRDMCGEVAA